jgi:hypothetical protein
LAALISASKEITEFIRFIKPIHLRQGFRRGVRLKNITEILFLFSENDMKRAGGVILYIMIGTAINLPRKSEEPMGGASS